MSDFITAAEGILGFLLIMAFWIGVQAYVRKKSSIAPDKDLLESAGGESCHNVDCFAKKQQEQHACLEGHSHDDLVNIVQGHAKGKQ